MNYFRFFLNNKKIVSFGFLMAFFSSYGQTFMVSLYVPGITEEFGLTSASFGTIYGSATILSAVVLMYVGKFLDNCNLRNYALMSVFVLIAACLVTATAKNLIWIFFGIWGLRFAGQGLLSHISNTSISKFFDSNRGTALSLAVMGYAAGEAFFPVITQKIIASLGWRGSIALNGLTILLILVPFVWLALSDKKLQYADAGQNLLNKIEFNRAKLWLDRRFQIIAANMFILPFMITGFFFHHMTLAGQKGWSEQWLALSFMGFAIGRTVFSLVSGRLIDKYTALRVLPYYLLPFIVALLTLIFINHPFSAPIYLTLTGISMGLSSTVKTALLAEIYGTDKLAGIKALSAALMVFSTALSPALFGFLLDKNLSFDFILWFGIILALSIIYASTRLPACVRAAQLKI